jgi:hypothetical protein
MSIDFGSHSSVAAFWVGNTEHAFNKMASY